MLSRDARLESAPPMNRSRDDRIRRRDDAAPEPVRAPEPWPAHPAAAVRELQRSAGNAAVSRMLQQGAGPGATLMRQPAPAPVCSPAEQAKLDELMSTTYTREDFHPDTGRGLFDAIYAPGDGDLTITVGIAFNFVDGDPADPKFVAAVGPAAAAAYTPDQFTWTRDEQQNWKDNAISQVLALWSGRYTFFTRKACWADTLPPVDVEIEIVERPAAGAGKAHFVTTVTKWPTDKGRQDAVTPPAAGADQSTARFHESGADGIENPDSRHRRRTTTSRARYNRVDTDNPGVIRFPQNVTEPSAADKTALRAFGATLGAPDMAPFPVTLTGHSSSEGAADLNMRISEDRARNVSNEIVAGGATRQPQVDAVGEAGAAPTAEWRRVDIAVGALEADQTTVAHEFGHMLGLGDEYPTSDTGSRPVGTPVAHSPLAERLIPGQQPILARHDESIMSVGEEVRPHHYVTFLEVLGKMTDTEGEWDIRPAAVQGPGDFPLPAPDGTATA
jgi:outer membrane protein OmpA-like peptidoglycan-associated protein